MVTSNELATHGHGSENSLAGCLSRLFWMAGGNVGLLLLAILIAQQPTWSLSVRDALFWAIALAVLLVRYVEVTRLGGLDVDGKPVTHRGLSRYLAGHLAASSALWCLGQSLHV
ncbi:MAG: hypothetical protein IT454_01085 [Planctomycetes bacterium]|nr:hypothetical protein [Planctomycetota bacterium]